MVWTKGCRPRSPQRGRRATSGTIAAPVTISGRSPTQSDAAAAGRLAGLAVTHGAVRRGCGPTADDGPKPASPPSRSRSHRAAYPPPPPLSSRVAHRAVDHAARHDPAALSGCSSGRRGRWRAGSHPRRPPLGGSPSTSRDPRTATRGIAGSRATGRRWPGGPSWPALPRPARARRRRVGGRRGG